MNKPLKRQPLVFVDNAYQSAYQREQNARKPDKVMWQRKELDVLLSLYGRRVATGEWRDYGIDALKNMAVFSVFKRAHDVPLYRIEKHPSLRHKQGMYAVVNTHGHVLKRGHNLAQVLKVFQRKKETVPHLY